jgi:hypothetical protein
MTNASHVIGRLQKTAVAYCITLAFVQDGLRKTIQTSVGNPYAWYSLKLVHLNGLK